MLQWNIKPLLLAKGISKPYTWLRQLNMSNDVAHRLCTGAHQRVDKIMIGKICEAAWCTPNDLFVYQPDGKTIIDDAHPLNALKAKAIGKLADKLKKLTPAQIAELDKLVDGLGM